MYVNYFDQEIKSEEENKTIGIILCKNKKENIIKYTLGNNKQIFASKYKMFFPEKSVMRSFPTMGPEDFFDPHDKRNIIMK